MPRTHYIGICIEPTKIYCIVGTEFANHVTNLHEKDLDIEEIFKIDIDLDEKRPIGKKIEDVCNQFRKDKYEDIVRCTKRICVCSHGPILSSDKNNDLFGKVSHQSVYEELRGLNLKKESDGLVSCILDSSKRVDRDDPLRIQNYVTCAAIGEAYMRTTNYRRNHGDVKDIYNGSRGDILVLLNIDESITGGVVFGFTAQRSGAHPEMGQILAYISKDEPASWAGISPQRANPKHDQSIHDMASIAALEARWGISLDKLQENPKHAAWDLEAKYLSQLVSATIYMYAPHQVVIGGPIMKTPNLLKRVRSKLHDRLYRNGGLYLDYPALRRLNSRRTPFLDAPTQLPEQFAESSNNDTVPRGLYGTLYFAAQSKMK